MGILLPAPIHEDEESSFGVNAPTSSTTVALSLGDALAIATARKLHSATGKSPAEVFRGFHPGGAIGAAAAATPLTAPSSGMSMGTCDSPTLSVSLPWEEITSIPLIPPFTLQPPPEQPRISRDMLVTLDQIPIVSASSSHSSDDVRLLDILLTAIQNPNAKSWVFLSPSEIIPPRHIRSLLSPGEDIHMRVSEAVAKNPGIPFVVPRSSWLLVPESTSVDAIRRAVIESRSGLIPVSVIGVVKDMASASTCIGVIEADDLLDG